MCTKVSVVLIACAIAARPSLAQSNISTTDKSAWVENVGWTNWRDAGGGTQGVVVGTDFLAGFIWGENAGWMNVGNGSGPYANTNGADFGVNIDANGDLNGMAWGENTGWINFGWAAPTAPERPRFDGTRFRGWAWGENVGWINLDDATHFVAVEGGTGPIPTLGQWAVTVFGILLLIAGTIVFGRRSSPVTM